MKLRKAIPSGLAKALTFGYVTGVKGLLVTSSGLNAPVGTFCRAKNPRGSTFQIVSFDGPQSSLMALEAGPPVSLGDEMYVLGPATSLPFGDSLLGRVVDPLCQPLDGAPLIHASQPIDLSADELNPLQRGRIQEPLDVGVRAINALLTVGKGQRIGIFAGSGVGKSTLLAMMARNTTATRVVVGLIGERGREVKEFVEEALGPEGLAKAIVVVAPADAPALLKIQGAEYSAYLAEAFRAQGHDCLLIMDSLTRYAMAAREIGLAVGEPPATKGYPPSVFSKIATLVERAGTGREGHGSITAFYTVLSEGDDMQDPVADSARAILDGHFILSRSLADEGQYPPIDVNASVSRVFSAVTDTAHQQRAKHFRKLSAAYARNRDLFSIGAYSRGSDPDADQAYDLRIPMMNLLTQGTHDVADLASSREALMSVLG